MDSVAAPQVPDGGPPASAPRKFLIGGIPFVSTFSCVVLLRVFDCKLVSNLLDPFAIVASMPTAKEEKKKPRRKSTRDKKAPGMVI